MAIRDVVTAGFGNGTYDPGVSKLPTRGYTIGVAVVIDVAGGQLRIPPNRPGQVICQNKPGQRIPINKPGQVIPGNDDL